ncbi:DUF4292 domain-containing protein [Adhaeribacter arboris]|uniref:DUF4292 domain-containing protein n=1 Tax=Adhaeribacter arboris TaxID=2072846 RepID=A0A2T2YLD2_9BACT|nr:DUF4292 domain-containing protein [Adhaeribacter arboris]PSR56318.1 DUF4292 domain-containing protein [Adhaeribacter arboris]
MNKRLHILYAICLVVWFSACKRNSISSSSAPEKLNKVNVINLDYTYFSAKGRMQFENEGEKINTGITIRMKKDTIIWISVVPALGIEVARLLITPDSVAFINRLEKTYFADNVEGLKNRFNVDLSFNMVQSLLVGNYVPGQNGNEKLIDEAPIQHTRQNLGAAILDQFISTETYKLKKLQISDPESPNTITVDYSDFENVGDKPVAKSTLIVTNTIKENQAKKMVASINLNKVDIDSKDLNFPFAIPPDYRRK